MDEGLIKAEMRMLAATDAVIGLFRGQGMPREQALEALLGLHVINHEGRGCTAVCEENAEDTRVQFDAAWPEEASDE